MMRGLFVLGLLALAATAAPPPQPPASAAALYSLMDQDALKALAGEAARRYAATPGDLDALRTLGIAYHNLAVLGASGASEKALDYLDQLNRLAPQDHVALAYRGSATTMVGRDSWNVLTKVQKVRLGIARIDEAVRLDDTNIVIRLVRATNSLLLPDLFERKPIARQDFTFIAQALETRKDGDPQLLAEACYQLAMLESAPSEQDQRRNWLEKARDAAPASDWGMKAARELQR
ncbi:MAG: hypothetical protein P4L83_10105 [Nevskia sp.]|nr:hypothetical protein [Nevskia sp.]